MVGTTGAAVVTGASVWVGSGASVFSVVGLAVISASVVAGC